MQYGGRIKSEDADGGSAGATALIKRPCCVFGLFSFLPHPRTHSRAEPRKGKKRKDRYPPSSRRRFFFAFPFFLPFVIFSHQRTTSACFKTSVCVCEFASVRRRAHRRAILSSFFLLFFLRRFCVLTVLTLSPIFLSTQDTHKKSLRSLSRLFSFSYAFRLFLFLLSRAATGGAAGCLCCVNLGN